MGVRVQSFSGSRCTLNIEKSLSVSQLKVKLQAALGIHRREQRLLAGCVLLSDDQLLGHLQENGIVDLALVRVDPERPRLLEGMTGGWLALEDLSSEWRSDKEVV